MRGLGFAQRMLGKRFPLALFQFFQVKVHPGGVVRQTILLQNMKFQHSRFVFGFAARHPVSVAFVGKSQADFGSR